MASSRKSTEADAVPYIVKQAARMYWLEVENASLRAELVGYQGLVV